MRAPRYRPHIHIYVMKVDSSKIKKIYTIKKSAQKMQCAQSDKKRFFFNLSEIVLKISNIKK